MKKINWQKVSAWSLDMLRTSGKPILGGLGMIGLSLLCKKLDVPYQVLLDPSYSTTRSVRAAAITPGLVMMPNNKVEAAINAIYENIRSQASDYYRYESAKKIVEILEENAIDLSDRTVSYAIMALNNISQTISSSYYKNCLTDEIAKIAKGDL